MPRTLYNHNSIAILQIQLKDTHDARHSQEHSGARGTFFGSIRGTRAIVSSPFAHPDCTVANLSRSVSIESPCAYLRIDSLDIFTEHLRYWRQGAKLWSTTWCILTVNALISYFTGDISLPSLLGGCRSLNKT